MKKGKEKVKKKSERKKERKKAGSTEVTISNSWCIYRKRSISCQPTGLLVMSGV